LGLRFQKKRRQAPIATVTVIGVFWVLLCAKAVLLILTKVKNKKAIARPKISALQWLPFYHSGLSLDAF